MILLDTDHVTLLKYPESERGARLDRKLRELPRGEIVAISIVSVEEQMRGWLAAIAKERRSRRQAVAYAELAGLFDYFRAFTIVVFDELAADRFDELRAARIRIGTMDLRIAAIVLVQNALFLTTNRNDFEKVPGLRFENWLD